MRLPVHGVELLPDLSAEILHQLEQLGGAAVGGEARQVLAEGRIVELDVEPQLLALSGAEAHEAAAHHEVAPQKRAHSLDAVF